MLRTRKGTWSVTRTNCLVHGRIYPDDAGDVVRTAPPTREAIAAASAAAKRPPVGHVTAAEQRATQSRERNESVLRDAVEMLRTRFIIRRR